MLIERYVNCNGKYMQGQNKETPVQLKELVTSLQFESFDLERLNLHGTSCCGA